MATDEDLARLAPAQCGLFAAACALRLAPLIDAFGSAKQRHAYHDALAAMWNGHGQVDAATVRAIERRILATIYPEQTVSVASFAATVVAVAGAALRACRAGADDRCEQAARAREGTEEVAEAIDHALAADGRWYAAEKAAQVQVLELLAEPGGEPSIKAVRLELWVVIAELSARNGWPLSPARLEPAVPRHRHPEPVAHPTAERCLVRADDTELTGPLQVRSGDVVRAECAVAEARIVRRDEQIVEITWPWPPGDGTLLLPVDPGKRAGLPIRLWPEAAELRPGDACRVGVPPMTVYALRAATYTTRRTPVPKAVLSLLTPSEELVGGFADRLAEFSPYDLPIELTLRHRAYGFLEPDDLVVDASGTALLFHPPAIFLTPDGEAQLSSTRQWPAAVVPQWPLQLRERDGMPAPQAQVAAVRAATATGNHDGVLAAWEAATGVALPPEDEIVAWFMRIGFRPPRYHSM
jgi:hypothetical protein